MPNRLPCEEQSPASEKTDSLVEVLGPMPRETLAAMVDYGLNDAEIGRYFKLGTGTVTSLRQYFGL